MNILPDHFLLEINKDNVHSTQQKLFNLGLSWNYKENPTMVKDFNYSSFDGYVRCYGSTLASFGTRNFYNAESVEFGELPRITQSDLDSYIATINNSDILPANFLVKVFDKASSSLAQHRLKYLGIDFSTTFNLGSFPYNDAAELFLVCENNKIIGHISRHVFDANYSHYDQFTIHDLYTKKKISKPESIKVKLNSEYEAVVSKNEVKVGCQTFPISIIQDLVNAKDELLKD